MAQQRSLQHHRVVVEQHPARLATQRDVELGEPIRPRHPRSSTVVHVDERRRVDVGGGAVRGQAVLARRVPVWRPAPRPRETGVRLSRPGNRPSPTRTAASNVPCVQLVVPVEEPQPQVEVAEDLVDLVEARHQPGLGDARDGRRARTFRSCSASSASPVSIASKPTRHVPVESAAELGELAAIGGADEQLGAEAAFERPDLSGHGRLAGPEFVTRRP